MIGIDDIDEHHGHKKGEWFGEDMDHIFAPIILTILILVVNKIWFLWRIWPLITRDISYNTSDMNQNDNPVIQPELRLEENVSYSKNNSPDDDLPAYQSVIQNNSQSKNLLLSYILCF